jgi:hypothetical protein
MAFVIVEGLTPFNDRIESMVGRCISNIAKYKPEVVNPYLENFAKFGLKDVTLRMNMYQYLSTSPIAKEVHSELKKNRKLLQKECEGMRQWIVHRIARQPLEEGDLTREFPHLVSDSKKAKALAQESEGILKLWYEYYNVVLPESSRCSADVLLSKREAVESRGD